MSGHSTKQGNIGKSHSIHTQVHFPSPASPIAAHPGFPPPLPCALPERRKRFLLYIPTPTCTTQPWLGQEPSLGQPQPLLWAQGLVERSKLLPWQRPGRCLWTSPVVCLPGSSLPLWPHQALGFEILLVSWILSHPKSLDPLAVLTKTLLHCWLQNAFYSHIKGWSLPCLWVGWIEKQEGERWK